MVSEMEALYQALPFDEYGKDEEKLRDNVERLEKAYDRREKLIGRIMEYGTGIETEKALNVSNSRSSKMGSRLGDLSN